MYKTAWKSEDFMDIINKLVTFLLSHDMIFYKKKFKNPQAMNFYYFLNKRAMNFYNFFK